MATLAQRLRRLDRWAMREHRFETAAGWTKTMSRWRWALVGVALNAAIVVAILALSTERWLAVVLMPFLLLGAFQAGAMKTEHDRLNGSDKVLGKRRPPAL